ncbi:MAG: hypothetical protein LBQ66_14220, partial [Planctomycetaceae bacterium]|nr:hypothetical protein [Planctomycetaceae bacterium]
TIQLQFPYQNDESKNITINSVPTPRAEIAELFRLANIPAPEIVPAGKTKLANTVDSKKKLKIGVNPKNNSHLQPIIVPTQNGTSVKNKKSFAKMRF